MRLPCHHPIRRDVTTLQSNHENNQESNGTGKLKSSSAKCEETEPLIAAAAASKHSSTYDGHTSSTKHDGSFVSSVNSVEGEDFNNIH